MEGGEDEWGHGEVDWWGGVEVFVLFGEGAG